MAKNQVRVIIDTNLWLSFLLTPSTSKLDNILSDSGIKLIFSKELIDEFLEVSQRPKFRKYFSFDDLQHLLFTIEEKAEFIEVSDTVNICRDPKDNFLLALAKEGKVNYLVTGDKDLLVLEKYYKTNIITVNKLIEENRRYH